MNFLSPAVALTVLVPAGWWTKHRKPLVWYFQVALRPVISQHHYPMYILCLPAGAPPALPHLSTLHC